MAKIFEVLKPVLLAGKIQAKRTLVELKDSASTRALIKTKHIAERIEPFRQQQQQQQPPTPPTPPIVPTPPEPPVQSPGASTPPAPAKNPAK